MTHSSASAPMIAALFSLTSFKRGNQSLFINLSGFPSIWTRSFSLATDTGRGMVPYDPVISTPSRSYILGGGCTIIHIQIYSSVKPDRRHTSIFKLKVLEHSASEIWVPINRPTFHSTFSNPVRISRHDCSR